MNTEKLLKIKQVKSVSGRPESQRRVLQALGLTRNQKTVTHHDTPIIRGMVAKVAHLVEVSE